MTFQDFISILCILMIDLFLGHISWQFSWVKAQTLLFALLLSYAHESIFAGRTFSGNFQSHFLSVVVQSDSEALCIFLWEYPSPNIRARSYSRQGSIWEGSSDCRGWHTRVQAFVLEPDPELFCVLVRHCGPERRGNQAGLEEGSQTVDGNHEEDIQDAKGIFDLLKDNVKMWTQPESESPEE